MTALLNRLGSLGVLLIASALLVGGLGGAAIAHRFDRLTADTVASQQHQGEDSQNQDKKQSKKNSKHAKQKPHQAQQQGKQGENQTSE